MYVVLMRWPQVLQRHNRCAFCAVIEPKLLELGYCCGGKKRSFLPVPLGCNGPRCPGLIGKDADYYEATVEPKTCVAMINVSP